MSILMKPYKPDMRPTRIVVTRPIFVAGVPRQKDDEAIVGYQDAVGLQAMGRATIIASVEQTHSDPISPEADLGEAQ